MTSDTTGLVLRHTLSRDKVEEKISSILAEAKPCGVDSYHIPSLSMSIKLRSGKTIEGFVRAFVEDRNQIKGIERRAKVRMKNRKK